MVRKSWSLLWQQNIFKKQRTAFWSQSQITQTFKCYLWHLSRDHFCAARVFVQWSEVPQLSLCSYGPGPPRKNGTKGLMRQCQLLRSDGNGRHLYGDNHETWKPHVFVNLGAKAYPICAQWISTKELQSIDAWHHQDWAPTSMPEWIPSISRPSAQDSKTPSRYLSLSDADMLNILGEKNGGMFFERVTKNEWSLANNMFYLRCGCFFKIGHFQLILERHTPISGSFRHRSSKGQKKKVPSQQ